MQTGQVFLISVQVWLLKVDDDLHTPLRRHPSETPFPVRIEVHDGKAWVTQMSPFPQVSTGCRDAILLIEGTVEALHQHPHPPPLAYI